VIGEEAFRTDLAQQAVDDLTLSYNVIYSP
jgi:hypothetical protein